MPQSYSIALNPPADRGGLFRAFRDPVADQGNLDNVRPWSDEEQGVLVICGVSRAIPAIGSKKMDRQNKSLIGRKIMTL